MCRTLDHVSPSPLDEPMGSENRRSIMARLTAGIWENGTLCMSVTAAVFALAAFCIKLLHGRLPVFEVWPVYLAHTATLHVITRGHTPHILHRSNRPSHQASCRWSGAHDSIAVLDASAVQIVGIRSAFSGIVTAGCIARMRSQGTEIKFFGDRANYPKLASRAVTGASAMALYYVSIRMLPLGDAVTIFFTNVVFTALASVLAGFERPSFLMALGCTLCVGAHFTHTSRHLWICRQCALCVSTCQLIAYYSSRSTGAWSLDSAD